MPVPTENYYPLLAYRQEHGARWGADRPVGHGGVITYDFSDSAADLPWLERPSLREASGYSGLNAGERGAFRKAAAILSAVSGLELVEVEKGGMIQPFAFDAGALAGWAYLPRPETVFMGLWRDAPYGPGGGYFETVLHELGHAAGLKHPFEGREQLAFRLDQTVNTVMSYAEGRFAQDGYRRFDKAALVHLYGADQDVTLRHDADAGRVAIIGGAGDDDLFGPRGDVLFRGRGGDDAFRAGSGDFAGDDELRGGAGRDSLFGGGGRDTLFGDRGDDRLELADGAAHGGAGNDVLVATGGRESGAPDLFGGGGDDVLRVRREAGRVDGGAGDDLLILRPSQAHDLDGARALLAGGDGADRLIAWHAVGAPTLRGGAGGDLLRAHDGAIRGFGGGGDDSLQGARGDDRLSGDGGADRIAGGAGRDRLQGGAGDDSLFGEAGRDVLRGGAGDDLMTGGAGDDALYGGPGDDALRGGPGADMFVFDGRSGRDAVRDFDLVEDRLTLAGAAAEYRVETVADGLRFHEIASGDQVTLIGLDAADFAAIDLFYAG